MTAPDTEPVFLALDHECPRCKAPSGIYCRTATGWTTSPHAARLVLTNALTVADEVRALLAEIAPSALGAPTRGENPS